MLLAAALALPFAELLPAASGFVSSRAARSAPRRAETAYPASAVAASLRAELDALMRNCHRADWDGYGAEAVGVAAFGAAQRFIQSLPVGIPKPDLSADPDGCVTFEWRKSPRRVLLVSVHPDYRLDYAALFGTAKNSGSEPFFGELPTTISNLVQRVYAA